MRTNVIVVRLSAVLLLSSIAIGTPPKANKSPVHAAPVLWREPADIGSRNLFYGPGGKAHEPHGRFTFKAEDSSGTNPKFDVTDENGVTWRVKLGVETRPEVAASRLVWAAGYFANEDYFMPVLHVENMKHLHRGGSMVSRDGTVHNVRLKRHVNDEKKLGNWSWSNSPFTDTREWYGLRVLMALMNNWDLKDINNTIYQSQSEPPEERYVVSDLGASFGPTGLDKSVKGKPSAYCQSKWIKSVSRDFVDFNVPSGPAANYYLNFVELGRRVGLLWLGHHIPRADARWMGNLLARLSPQQIRDVFRASGYSDQEIEALSRVVEQRIGELKTL